MSPSLKSLSPKSLSPKVLSPSHLVRRLDCRWSRSSSSRGASRRLAAVALSGLMFSSLLSSVSCATPRSPIPGGYALCASASGYELQLLIDGVPASTFEHAGETHVLGQVGSRYTLRVTNHTGRRIEAVAAVDGRDAMSGKPADPRENRGYLVPAWGSIDIDGWRLSNAEVAAFRFSSVADSYAVKTGSARDVGVIGVAVFAERYVAPPRPVYQPVRPVQPQPEPQWNYESERPYGMNKRSDDSSLGRPSSPAAAPQASSDGAAIGRGAVGGHAESRAKSAPSKRAIADADSFEPRAESRPGLGTEFGEAVSSPVRQVSFVRANSTRPTVILGARYNDRDGLIALGIDVDRCCVPQDDLAWRQSATPFPVRDRGYAQPPADWQSGCCVR